MSTHIKSRVVNFKVDEAYQHILNFIRIIERKENELRVKLVESKDSEYIKARVSSGFLDVSFVPKNGRTLLQFNFDFSRRLYRAMIISLFGVIWFILMAMFLNFRYLVLAPLQIGWYLYAVERAKTIVNEFMERLDFFLIQLPWPTEVTPAEFKKEAGERRPLGVDALYERLTRRYDAAYGRGVWMVERKIQSYMKEGLSREEAIRRLAEKEGILEGAERERILEMTKGDLPPDILHLYQRLIDRYCSVYGRSRSALEHKIEEYMWEGLSRKEAIKRIAEEEGIA